jgi:hypothetical protein
MTYGLSRDDAGRILEVEGHQRRRPALRADIVVELLQRSDGPSHRDDMRSRLGEGQCSGATDPARSDYMSLILIGAGLIMMAWGLNGF